MKYFLIALLLSVAIQSQAAPPPIYPGESGSESSYPIVRFGDAGCLVAWFYDGGHKWIKDGFYGAGVDCERARTQVVDAVGLDPSYIPNFVLGYALGRKLNSLPHAQKDALWNEVFNLHPGDPTYAENKAANEISDAGILLQFIAIPYPTATPPSGWVTQTNVAYRRADAIGSNVLSPTGSVPLGTPCKSSDSITNAIGTYHAIVDRTKVTMTKVGTYAIPRPTTLYGKCMP